MIFDMAPVQTTPESVEQLISTQTFMPHGILDTISFRRTPALSTQCCVKYQMGGSKFDEVSCTLSGPHSPSFPVPSAVTLVMVREQFNGQMSHLLFGEIVPKLLAQLQTHG